MKRETMKWLRCRADGSTWWPPDVEAQDVIDELERLRRENRAQRRALDVVMPYAPSTVCARAGRYLNAALKKGGRK